MAGRNQAAEDTKSGPQREGVHGIILTAMKLEKDQSMTHSVTTTLVNKC